MKKAKKYLNDHKVEIGMYGFGAIALISTMACWAWLFEFEKR